MLRWSLVRVLDNSPRFSSYFSPQTSPPSRVWFSRTHADAAVSVADEVRKPDTSVITSPSPCPQDASRSFSRSSAGLLESCHNRRAACVRTRYSAIDILSRYLAPENITSDQPLVYSPTTIRSLYYRAESRNQLGLLDSNMLTLLIGMFGSLSTDPRIFVVHRVPFTSRLLRASTCRTHWAFVLKVGRYKLERGMPLQGSDRFWLMCAELSTVRARSSLKPLPCDAYSAILRARTHYRIIRRHSCRPEVHAYYLETLLDVQDPRLLDFAAYDLSVLLRTHRVCHPRIQHLLYGLVIRYGKFLSTRSQEAILAALWSRVCQGTNRTSDLVSQMGLSNIALDDCTLDSTAVTRFLSSTLLNFTVQLSGHKSGNSIGDLLCVFSPAYPLALRWSSLLSLSIFNSPKMLRFNETLWTSNHAMPPVSSCWQVIFGLATIEKVLQELPSTFAMQTNPTAGVLETTRYLYQLWSTTMKSCTVSRDLACAIAASFLKIASILADANLFHDCQVLYRLEGSLKGSRTHVQKFFTTQYIAAAVRVQGLLPGVVPMALEAFSSDLKQQYQVLVSAVEALAPIDVSLADTLHNAFRGKEMETDLRATYALAMSFAKCGALHQAILLLNDSRFSLEKRGIVVSAIACGLRVNPRIRHTQSVFVAIADELGTLYHSHVPPEHFRGHLEQLLVILAQHGRGRQLFPVVLSIFRRLPSFFQPRFFVRYCRILVRHKQFTTALKLLDAIATVYPKLYQSLCIFTDRVAAQTNASQVFKRITLRGPTSLRLCSRLRHCPSAGPPLEHSLQELPKSGRLLAATRVFNCAAPTISSVRCTALGNILLHGVSRQPTLRNGRRVRKVLALLESLVKNQGFRPDRVTFNILVRAITEWRSELDSPRLRGLFDRFVRGGYPAADYSPLHPPFGTRQTLSSGLSGFSKFSSSISFEKHSRPLFKMFIKAFYLCNDVEAARRVVEILKVEEYKNAVTKEARQRARSSGRIKAAQRNVIPPDVTTLLID